MKNKKAKSKPDDISEQFDAMENGPIITGNSEKANGADAGVKKTNKARSGAIAQNMLPEDYRPSEDEEFMNPMQLLYFQRKLEAWKAELLDDASGDGMSNEFIEYMKKQIDEAEKHNEKYKEEQSNKPKRRPKYLNDKEAMELAKEKGVLEKWPLTSADSCVTIIPIQEIIMEKCDESFCVGWNAWACCSVTLRQTCLQDDYSLFWSPLILKRWEKHTYKEQKKRKQDNDEEWKKNTSQDTDKLTREDKQTSKETNKNKKNANNKQGG